MGTLDRAIPRLTEEDRRLVEDCRARGLHTQFEEVIRQGWHTPPRDMNRLFERFMSTREEVIVPRHALEYWRRKLAYDLTFFRKDGVLMIVVGGQVHSFMRAVEFTGMYEKLKPAKICRQTGSQNPMASADRIFSGALAKQRNTRLIT